MGRCRRPCSNQGHGGTLIYNPSATQDVTTEVLKSTLNIAPTVRKDNGDRIQVLVARDVDFRRCMSFVMPPTAANAPPRRRLHVRR